MMPHEILWLSAVVKLSRGVPLSRKELSRGIPLDEVAHPHSQAKL